MSFTEENLTTLKELVKKALAESTLCSVDPALLAALIVRLDASELGCSSLMEILRFMVTSNEEGLRNSFGTAAHNIDRWLESRGGSGGAL